MGDLPNCTCSDNAGHRRAEAHVREGVVDVLYQCVVCGATRTEVIALGGVSAVVVPDVVTTLDEPTELEP